jgi:hypothetical protein
MIVNGELGRMLSWSVLKYYPSIGLEGYKKFTRKP